MQRKITMHEVKHAIAADMGSTRLLDTVSWSEGDWEAFEDRCFASWLEHVKRNVASRYNCPKSLDDFPAVDLRGLFDNGMCHTDVYQVLVDAERQRREG